MANPSSTEHNSTSRRSFLRASSLLMAGGAVGGGLSLSRSAHAFGGDEIKIGLIGCGSRGAGATVQALNTAVQGDLNLNGSVKLTAMGDVFRDRLQSAYRSIRSKHAERVDVPGQRRFVGLDAYRQVLDCDIDLVLLAAPPGFRPLHFEAAVQAGKHVFMEKPLGTDAPGLRRLLTASEEAKRQGLMVAVGLQRHHEPKYQETIARLQDGAIGDILFTRVYWNGSGAWVRPRQEGQTELEYQLRNWYYFNWLSGDHLCEQHIHNLDVSNWLLGGPPSQCNGQGGRQVRTGAEYGQIFDHHFLEYTYPNGTKMFSQCRHIRGCWNRVSEHAHGTQGHADISNAKIYGPDGEVIFKSNAGGDGHQREQDDLFQALRRGEIYNEVESAAASTMTAIMGRMASYSGQTITWDQAVDSELALAHVDSLQSVNDPAPLQPLPQAAITEESYPIAQPGKTNVL